MKKCGGRSTESQNTGKKENESYQSAEIGQLEAKIQVKKRVKANRVRRQVNWKLKSEVKVKEWGDQSTAS